MRNYHDSRLEQVALGPRKEVTLFVRLDPVWNREAPGSVAVRFGGVANFEEVSRYFSAIRPPVAGDAFIGELVQFEPHGKGTWLVDVEGYGPIQIQCAKVTEK